MGLTRLAVAPCPVLCLVESRQPVADLKAFPTQVIFLVDGIRDVIRTALEEGSIEKVRDLLIEIRERLDAMADEAPALSPEGNDNAHRP
jgi:hypothetical protein